ncbi:MAG: hypothetical protein MO852_05485, partial [Candidatus Devosia euplotis]|nr:hypothetical protein [Candidatus Devosia euplotis]
MTDKKPGFLKRLFGGDVAPPAPAETDVPGPKTSEPDAAAVTPDAIVPPPEPEAAANAAPVAEHVPLPGPPETTPDHVEAVEARAHAGAPAPADAPAVAEQTKGWFARLTSDLRRSSD